MRARKGEGNENYDFKPLAGNSGNEARRSNISLHHLQLGSRGGKMFAREERRGKVLVL